LTENFPAVPLDAMPGSLSCLLSAACWAFAVTLFRPAIRDRGSAAVNFFKCLVAGLVFLAILWTSGSLEGLSEGMTTWYWSSLAAASLLGMSLGDTFVFLAASRIGAQRTFLIGTLGPIQSALLGLAFFGENLESLQVLGILLTLGGVALVVLAEAPRGGPDRPGWTGWLPAFLAMFFQSLGLILNKPSLEVMDAGPNAMLRLFLALPFILLLGGRPGKAGNIAGILRPGKHTVRLVLGSLIGTVLGFWLYIYGVKHTKAGIAASMAGTTPIFAIPAAWVLEGRKPTARSLAGTLLAVAGASLVSLY